jgi:hypothetical protein
VLAGVALNDGRRADDDLRHRLLADIRASPLLAFNHDPNGRSRRALEHQYRSIEDFRRDRRWNAGDVSEVQSIEPFSDFGTGDVPNIGSVYVHGSITASAPVKGGF